MDGRIWADEGLLAHSRGSPAPLPSLPASCPFSTEPHGAWTPTRPSAASLAPHTCQQPAAPPSLPSQIRFHKILSPPAASCTNRPPLATAERQHLPAERRRCVSPRSQRPRGTGSALTNMASELACHRWQHARPTAAQLGPPVSRGAAAAGSCACPSVPGRSTLQPSRGLQSRLDGPSAPANARVAPAGTVTL